MRNDWVWSPPAGCHDVQQVKWTSLSLRCSLKACEVFCCQYFQMKSQLDVFRLIILNTVQVVMVCMKSFVLHVLIGWRGAGDEVIRQVRGKQQEAQTGTNRYTSGKHNQEAQNSKWTTESLFWPKWKYILETSSRPRTRCLLDCY